MHNKLMPWCQEVAIHKEGHTAPHRPVQMGIKGQQVCGPIDVHKRPPALRQPLPLGPVRVFDGRRGAVGRGTTALRSEVGRVPGETNVTRVTTDEADTQPTGRTSPR